MWLNLKQLPSNHAGQSDQAVSKLRAWQESVRMPMESEPRLRNNHIAQRAVDSGV